MLVLLTRVLLWATIGLLVWYILTKIIPPKYLTWFGGVIVLALIVASFADPNDETIGTIWRLISLPLTPLGATILLLGSAISEGVKKVKGQQVAAALAILLLTSLPIVSRSLARQSEQEIQNAFTTRAEQCADVCPVDVQGEGARIDRTGAIVVLGSDAGDAKGTVAFQSDTDQTYNSTLVPRLIYAAQLYREVGNAPLVIVTADPGGNNAASEQKRRNIRNVLIDNGVSSDRIELSSTGVNVHGTAKDVNDLLTNRQVLAANRENRNERTDRRVMLVAPAMTMTRSALTFENMGMEVIAKPTDFYSVDTWSGGDTFTRLPDIIPSVDALQLTSRYWDEVLTSTYYFLRGWLPSFNFGWDSNIEL